VFAPFVEEVVPATMLFVPSFFACLLLGAYLWQTLPVGFTRQYAFWRIAFMAVPVVAAVAVCGWAGPLMERLLFAGDIKGWLAWQPGPDADMSNPFASAIGGWALLLLPLAILVVTLVINRIVTPAMRRAFTGSSREKVAWVEVTKFLVATVAAILVAVGMGAVFNLLKLDPRFDLIMMHTDMSPMDIYVQRNALIVGVVMGFAVIPIVYTIGDDALTAVPDHLRSASLGCGATTWQTSIRIVIPTAMSGLFSALMIGLGRAVGETMIVLMALGNTAIMDWNIFNGARTLSANIAVELPEAVRNSAHYRTLFLAGLVLFAMTFVVNTVAESVRLRFRKRAYQL
jgi:phosphate transport system permease protein